jgi:intracellular multiplication protein IcmL
MENNSFYRHHYHQVLMTLMLIITLMIAAVGVLAYQVMNRPLPQFDAVRPDGSRMHLTPYLEPNLRPETILRWASKAATVAYTFSFNHYKEEIAAVKPYFTEDGYQDYLRSVSALINDIVAKKLFVNGVVSGTPVISNEGDIPGKGYVWRVQIPFLVVYQSSETTSKRNFTVVISIVRVPTEVNPQGIGIDQFVMV